MLLTNGGESDKEHAPTQVYAPEGSPRQGQETQRTGHEYRVQGELFESPRSWFEVTCFVCFTF